MKFEIKERDLVNLLDDVIYLEKIMEQIDNNGGELPAFEYDEELAERMEKYKKTKKLKKTHNVLKKCYNYIVVKKERNERI